MASISSSASTSLDGALLRLRQQGGAVTVMPLYPASDLEPNVLTLQPGSVRQDRSYYLQLLFPKGGAPDCAEFLVSVNGEDIPCVRTSMDCPLQSLQGDEVYEGFEIAPRDHATAVPFSLVYGYARIEVVAIDAMGNEGAPYRTKDILCTQATPVNTEDVERILQTLIADPAKDQVLSWILSDGEAAGEDRYSLVEGGFQQGRDRSVETYLRLVEQGLDAVERSLPVLRTHAASRMTRQQQMVDASQARRFGSREAMWLAMNPQVLRPAAAGNGALSFRGRQLMPGQIASTRIKKDYNVYENQILVAFLEELCSKLSDFQAKLDRDEEFFLPARGQGALVSQEEESCSFLLVAMRMLMRRHRDYGARAESLRARAIKLLRMLHHIMPGVEAPSLSSLPLRKTKTFKEVYAYSQIYIQIERFLAFGETPYTPDGLVISIMRLDRIFEFYGLYRLLDGLHGLGFELDRSYEEFGGRAVYAGAYEDEGRYQRTPSSISNVFHLVRSDIKALVLYEPSVYLDEREMHGCTLHKLGGNVDPYTPDYVVILGQGGERRTLVLDAKFSHRNALTCQTESGGGSRWEKCVRKYLRNMVDGATGRLPDGLWLLTGIRDDAAPLMVAETLPWLNKLRSNCESGMFMLSPESDISVLLDAMGLDRQSVEAGRLGNGKRAMALRPDLAEERKLRGAGGARVSKPAPVHASVSPAASTAAGVAKAAEAPNPAGASVPSVAERPVAAPAEEGATKAAPLDVPAAGSEQANAVPVAEVEGSELQAEELAVPPAQKPEQTGALTTSVGYVFGSADVFEEEGPSESEPAVLTPEQQRAEEAKARRADKIKERNRAQQEEKKRRQEREKEKAQAKKEAKQAAKAAKAKEADAKPAKAKQKVAKPTKAAKGPGVEEMVREIIELCPSGDTSPLFESVQCRQTLGIDKPLLRRDKAKDYRQFEHNGEELFYYAPGRRPDYPIKLQNHIRKMRQ